MSKRVTVVIDDEVYERIQKLQAKMIQDTNRWVSFSKLINDNLAKSTKKK